MKVTEVTLPSTGEVIRFTDGNCEEFAMIMQVLEPSTQAILDKIDAMQSAGVLSLRNDQQYRKTLEFLVNGPSATDIVDDDERERMARAALDAAALLPLSRAHEVYHRGGLN